MKSNLIALITIALVSVVSNAYALNRNLSGGWTTSSGDTWVIAHVGSQGTFSTTSYSQDVGRISFNFHGAINGRSGGEDQFSFSGEGEQITIRIAGKLCTISSRMSAAGYVSGEFGGRVIQMEYCTVRASARCQGVDEPIPTTINCSGAWT